MRKHIYEQLTKIVYDDVAPTVTLIQLPIIRPPKLKRHRFLIPDQIVYDDVVGPVTLIQADLTIPVRKKRLFKYDMVQQIWVDDLETPTRFNLISFFPKHDPPYGGRQV